MSQLKALLITSADFLRLESGFGKLKALLTVRMVESAPCLWALGLVSLFNDTDLNGGRPYKTPEVSRGTYLPGSANDHFGGKKCQN